MSKVPFEEIEKIIGKTLSVEQKAAAKAMRATVVSAGAGSGKTTVLSYRFMNLLSEGVDADKILTLTFTKKATAEMYERIYSFLSKLSKEYPEEFKDQLENHFPKAVISTMDSFWGEIARAGSLDYGFTRDFVVLSKPDLEDIVKNVIESLDSNDSLTQEERDSLDMLMSSTKRSELISIFLKIAENTNVLSSQTIEIQNEAFSKFYDSVEAEDYPGKALNLLDTSKELLENVKNGFKYFELIEKNKNRINSENFSELEKFKFNKYPNDDVKRVIKSFNEEYIGLYFPLLQRLRHAKEERIQERFNAIIPKFLEILTNEKRRLKALTYKDIEAIAKDTLLTNKSIRNYYKKKFKYIMVDEFQDNNIIQKELLYLLSEDINKFSSSIPKAFDMEPNKLFLVGDSKQSIYRFRGADVSVFNAIEKEIVDDMKGDSLTLNTNYRSSKSLVDHYNSVFRNILKEKKAVSSYTEIVNRFQEQPQVSFSAIHSDINASEGKDLPTTIEYIEVEIPRKSNEIEYFDTKETEAKVIANKIKEIVESKSLLKAKGVPVKYEDIAVLFPKKTIQMELEREFRNSGIPYTVVESNSATSEGIAYDFYSFLQLLVYPDDKKAFMTVMNSPFVRLTDNGQKAFLSDIKDRFSVPEPSTLDFNIESDNVTYSMFYEKYCSLKKKIGRVPLTEILDELYYDSGYHSFIVSSDRIAPYESHYNYLWSLAKNYDETDKNIVVFLDFLRPLIGEAKTLPDVSVQSIQNNGVQLMTVHKSKGLEFPVVFLCYTTSKREGGMGYVPPVISTTYKDKDITFIDASDWIEINDGLKIENEPDFNAIKHFFDNAEKERLEEEKKRTLYVALTRAENHFFFTSVALSVKNKTESDNKTFTDLYSASLETTVHKTELPPIEKDEEYFNPPKRDKSWYNLDIAESGEYGVRKEGVKNNDKKDNSKGTIRLPFIPEVDEINRRENSFSYFGTLVHKAFEDILNNNVFDLTSSNGEVSKESEAKLKEAAINIASSFPKSQFYKDYIEGKEYKTEVRFYLPGEKVVLEGSADLVIFGKERNLVVDYKTDSYKNPEEHFEQLSTYAKALRELYNKPCDAIVLYVRDFSTGPLWKFEEIEK